MKTLKFIAVLITAISFVFFTSCDKGKDDEEITKIFLVDYELVPSSFTIENAKAVLAYYNLPEMEDFAELLKYEIQTYKVTYKTLFEGDTILVSGLVAAPIPRDKNETFPIMSYQHGTIVEKTAAPSVNPSGDYMTYIASTGMIVVMADYIGFGVSSNEFHPFMHNQYTVNAVLDMIRASEEMIAIEKPCDSNGHLFLFGYSQGGSATLGALSAIENNNANSDIEVTAASCGAGAYDLAELRSWIMQQDRYEQPYFIAYLLESYSRYAGISNDYSLVFSEPFVPLIPDMFNGISSANIINAQFGTFHVGGLFNDNFEDDEIFNTADEYASFRQAFAENKIEAWPLSTSLSIYYGSEDYWVPGNQSLKLFQQFQGNGSGGKVTLKRLEGMNHQTAFLGTLTESLDWFLSFK